VNLQKAKGKKIKVSKKKLAGTKKSLSKISLRLTLFEVKEKKMMDEEKDLLASKKALTKKQLKRMISLKTNLKFYRKEIPKAQDEVSTMNEKYNILKGKAPTPTDVYRIDKKIRMEKRRIVISGLRIVEARKAWDESEVDFTRNKTKPQKSGLKGKMLRFRKVYKDIKEQIEFDTKKLIKLTKMKKEAIGVKIEYKKKKLVFKMAMKKIKLAKKKETISFKAFTKEANNPKANPQLVKLLKDKAAAFKAAVGKMEIETRPIMKDYKKVQVTYFIQIGKLKPPTIITPAAKKRAQKAKVQELMMEKYLDEKETVDKQQQVFDNLIFENKEAKKLGFKDAVLKTQKKMKKAKAKLDKLNEVFLPIKTLRENYEEMKKAVKEERFKDVTKLKNKIVAAKKGIADVQGPLIIKALKKLHAAKNNLTNMKLVVENNDKIKLESGDLEKVEKIVGNKDLLRQKEKELAAVQDKVNKAVIKESAKDFKRKQRRMAKYDKKYAALSGQRIQLYVKKLEARLETVKKTKDDNKKALVKRALRKVQEAQKEFKLQQGIDNAIAIIARENKNVLDAKAAGKISEITAAEKKLEQARGGLFKANQERFEEVRDVVKMAREKYLIGKKNRDVNLMKRMRKRMRKFKRRMGRIVLVSKQRKRFILVSKKLDDDKYMAEQDKLIEKAKEDVIKAELTGRERAIKIAQKKVDSISKRKELQQVALNAERIRDSSKELRICKKNVEAAIKTKNFDLIFIARRELKHARTNIAKTNVIKIEMAKKILDEKEEKKSKFKQQKKELRKEVKYMLKKANVFLLAAKKANNRAMIKKAKETVQLHMKEQMSISMSGSKKSVEMSFKSFGIATEIYKKVIAVKGEGSDEGFAAEEELKKAQKIMKYEKAYFKANIEFKKAEKSVVDEKKAKKRALVFETRGQLKESKDMFKFTKLNGSKYQLKAIKREIRGNRKSMGKIT